MESQKEGSEFNKYERGVLIAKWNRHIELADSLLPEAARDALIILKGVALGRFDGAKISDRELTDERGAEETLRRLWEDHQKKVTEMELFMRELNS